ncbi:MAG TPA: cytochrome c3 family protein [Polyangia bacterium]|jgi:hypothetical protein
MRRRALATVTVLALAAAAGSAARAGISGTKHDLSVSGPGPIKSTAETETCRFCHAPHRGAGQRPLWNRRDPGSVFRRSNAMTFDAFYGTDAPAPDGASLMCLSCHDGTIAVGAVVHGATAGSAPAIPSTSRAYIGRDLSGTHPVSFVYTDELVARNNQKDMPLRSVAEVRAAKALDARDKVQCTSCHDPHSDANRGASGVPFYRGAEFSEVCARCHRF